MTPLLTPVSSLGKVDNITDKFSTAKPAAKSCSVDVPIFASSYVQSE